MFPVIMFVCFFQVMIILVQLARRLFYSFAEKEREFLIVEDIESLFPTKDEADRAYALFDKDSNGDVSREEMEMACL